MIRTTSHALARSFLAAFVSCSAVAAHAADFAGTPAAIPDDDLAGVTIPIAVSGNVQAVKTVRVSLGLSHPFVGDIRATLTSPNGNARLVLMGKTGYRRSGGTSPSRDLAGTYIFDDTATGDLWIDAVNGAVPAGRYRTTTAGGTTNNAGGCSSSLTRAFGGLPAAQANGNWTLQVADEQLNDVGTVTGVLLSIDNEPNVFEGDFEDALPAPDITMGSNACTKVLGDMTGSGRASYTLVRNTGGGPDGAITWFVRDNDGTATGAITDFLLGRNGDFFQVGDFDGDGIADAAVYRSNHRNLLVRRSAQPGGPPMLLPLDVIGLDPDHPGDYDGDGVTDVAGYENGATAGQPSFFHYRRSSTNERVRLQAGMNGDFAAGGLDLDGDRRADIALQGVTPADSQVATVRYVNGLTGAIGKTFTFGNVTDVIQVGQVLGNELADFIITRGANTFINWQARDSQTDVADALMPVGKSASDFPALADYDGDGLEDYAVWRPSATPDVSAFYVRRSTQPNAPLLEVKLGFNQDFPPLNYRTH